MSRLKRATKEKAQQQDKHAKSGVKDDLLWDSRWVRKPQQGRSERTRVLLLNAAQQILEEDGPEKLTISAVAKLAGCSVGNMYHYFQDRQTLIYAVIDRFAEGLADRVERGLDEGQFEGMSLMDILEANFRYWVKLQSRYPGTIRSNRLLALQDPLIAARMYESGQKARHLILDVLRERFHEVNHPDTEQAVIFVLETFQSMLTQWTMGSLPDRNQSLPIRTNEEFTHEMLLMAAGYLQISGWTGPKQTKAILPPKKPKG